MTAALLVKWILVLIFIPLVFISLRLAQRYLGADHPARKLLERHGVTKVASYTLFVLYAAGGVFADGALFLSAHATR